MTSLVVFSLVLVGIIVFAVWLLWRRMAGRPPSVDDGGLE